MHDRRYLEDLSIEELEQELLTRRREQRLARMRRIGLADEHHAAALAHLSPTTPHPPNSARVLDDSLADLAASASNEKTPFQIWRERILLGIEIAALLGLIVIIASFAISVRRLNADWREQQSDQALPAPTATALIRVSILPGGHKPPTIEGGEAEPLGAMPKVAVPTPGPRSPTRLIIPAIDVDAPIVQGVDWEQLKKGAGHLIGSANPGERGNCFIAGHNDIYGEIFRDLQDLKVGDEIIVYAGQQSYRYIVRATRIVEPDDVSVMYPTSSPVLTLLTCYPYMIDSHRLVVIAELER
jgi:sortase A